MLAFIKRLQGRPKEERAFVAFSMAVVFTFLTILLWVGTFRSKPEVVASEMGTVDTSAYVEEHTTSVDLSPFYVLKKEFSSLTGLIREQLGTIRENVGD